jgi:hypothetical protein
MSSTVIPARSAHASRGPSCVKALIGPGRTASAATFGSIDDAPDAAPVAQHTAATATQARTERMMTLCL